eukprot:gb/GECH01009725.1/.p1 GENE.gb/GECH01009725.1/~~gb/GECH01009725.1/.p1  ORF type:complete len:255 (+),score=5.04 gb/GECH01009725.1/:1-765(+)
MIELKFLTRLKRSPKPVVVMDERIKTLISFLTSKANVGKCCFILITSSTTVMGLLEENEVDAHKYYYREIDFPRKLKSSFSQFIGQYGWKDEDVEKLLAFYGNSLGDILTALSLISYSNKGVDAHVNRHFIYKKALLRFPYLGSVFNEIVCHGYVGKQRAVGLSGEEAINYFQNKGILFISYTYSSFRGTNLSSPGLRRCISLCIDEKNEVDFNYLKEKSVSLMRKKKNFTFNFFSLISFKFKGFIVVFTLPFC